MAWFVTMGSSNLNWVTWNHGGGEHKVHKHVCAPDDFFFKSQKKFFFEEMCYLSFPFGETVIKDGEWSSRK